MRFVCVRVCAHIVAIGRRSLVESIPTSPTERSREASGGRWRKRVLTGAEMTRRETRNTRRIHLPTARAGIRTRAQVKDDTVSDSFPAGDGEEKEVKRLRRESGEMEGAGGRRRRDTGRN